MTVGGSLCMQNGRWLGLAGVSAKGWCMGVQSRRLVHSPTHALLTITISTLTL